uniref:Uncharacterized protein n=1 Tax=Picea sitchensis TaxID=3332 RepID=A0A6B9XV85_PICSI|nr:hypothetical protein Q903MT_gene4085 [Picea sitchensis]
MQGDMLVNKPIIRPDQKQNELIKLGKLGLQRNQLNQLNQGKRLTGSRSAPFTFTSAGGSASSTGSLSALGSAASVPTLSADGQPAAYGT